MSDLLRAAQALRTTRNLLADLRIFIENSVARPLYWSSLPLPAEVMAARDEAARAERAERTDLALGESPAPTDVHLLDVEAAIVTALLCCEAMARHELDLAPRHRGRDDAHSATLALERALDQLSPQMASYVAAQADSWARLLSETLGLSQRPLTLRAKCPFCSCEDTLRLFPPRDAAHEAYIACCSGVCDPPDRDVAGRIGNRPYWTLRWWGWLAERLNQPAA